MSMKRIMNKTKYLPVETLEYKDKKVFEGGLVKNSPHKCNKVYLVQGDMYTHLRTDEAMAIIRCLSMALWCNDFISHRPKTKWLTLKQLEKTRGCLG